MKKSSFILLLIPFFYIGTSYAQCYKPTLNDGIKSYNSGSYEKAKKQFEAAKICPDKESNADKTLNEWIKKCSDEIKKTTGEKTKKTSTTFTLSPPSLSFFSDGGLEYVSIEPSNTKWDHFDAPDWVYIAKDNDNSIIVRCTPNSSTSTKNAKITIISGEQRRSLSITQAGKTEEIKDENRFSIQSIDIAGFDKNGKMLTNYGDPIVPNTYSIKARFVYDNLQNDKAKIILSAKITDPNNRMVKNNQSTDAYSLANVSFQLDGENKTNLTIIMPEFGQGNGTLFSTSGTYRYDIYCNDKRKASGKFVVKEEIAPPPPINNTLTVSTNSIRFDQDGTSTTKSVVISTNAENFSYINVPSWLRVTRDGNYVYFSADKYYEKGGYRSASIKVNAGNAPEKTIYVEQSGPSKRDNPLPLKMTNNNVGLSLGYVQKNWVSRLDDGSSYGYGIGNDKPVSGLQAGIRTDFYFSPNNFGLGIATGLFYEFYYSKSDVFEHELGDFYSTFQEHSLYLPLHLIYRFDFNRNFGIFIKGGLGFDCGISAVYSQTDVGASDPFYTSDNLYGDTDFGVLTRFNASGEFGGGIQIKRVLFDISFSKGLLNLTSGDGYTTNQNKRIMASIGYMF